jgi:hypothetical protein
MESHLQNYNLSEIKTRIFLFLMATKQQIIPFKLPVCLLEEVRIAFTSEDLS